MKKVELKKAILDGALWVVEQIPGYVQCTFVVWYLSCMTTLPYSLKSSRIKYFAVWLNSAQKQIFTDKIFVVERELL